MNLLPLFNLFTPSNKEVVRIVLTPEDNKELQKAINMIMNSNHTPKIVDVIFNDPATIVKWSDQTKTVVKCQEGDRFDPEKGLVMAIAKKYYGNKGSFNDEIKKWLTKYDSKIKDDSADIKKQLGLEF